MARIILLTQQTIDRMINDPAFQDFPFLSTPPRLSRPQLTRAVNCGGCRSRRRTRRYGRPAGAIDYPLIKKAVATMPITQQEAIKSLLGCTGLKIQWRDRHNKVQRRVI